MRVGRAPYHVTVEERPPYGGVSILIKDREIRLDADWEVGGAMMRASIDGEDVTVHVSDRW